ncbi:MAG: TetR/AcrR family transcriptional regulator [Sphingomonadales bacterium]|jgi:AcrR family transcriptional regulator
MEVQERILRTAAKLFMELGVRSVSMDDVAKALSMSKKTIYKHYQDKDQLVFDTISMHIAEMEKNTTQIMTSEANPVLQIAKIADFVLEMNKNVHPSVLFDLQKFYPASYTHLTEHRNRFALQSVNQNLQKGVELGLFREDMHRSRVARIYMCLIFSMFQNTLFDGEEIRSFREEYIETIKYHLHAVTTEKGKNLFKEISWLNFEKENL